jgi:hypothetical protein
MNALSDIEFVRDGNGNYPVAKVTEGGAAPTDNIPTADGNMYYIDGVTENGITAFSLKVNPLATKYGVIPAEYADTNAYPFAVFMDGQFVRADTSWALAVSRPKDMMYGASGAGKEMQILLRRNYTTTSSDGNYGLWYLIGGHVVVDLNGFTLSRAAADSQYLFDISYRDTPNKSDSSKIDKHDVNVTVKNGNISAGRFIVGIGINANYTQSKSYNLTFDQVKIIQPSDASDGKVIVDWDHNNGSASGSMTLKFNNCTFDLSNARTDVKLFSVGGNNGKITTDIQVIGGNIIASALTSSTIFNTGKNDTASFVKTSDGRYTTLTMPNTATAPTVEYNTSDGAMKFAKIEVNGSDIIYGLVKLSTEYGTIPDQYASPLDYPFVYFEKNGTFKFASNLFYGANSGDSIIGKAKEYLKGNVFDATTKTYTGTVYEAYILMRRDYALASDENYDNLAQIQGNMYIDLGGFTLTSEHRVLFPSCIKGWSGSGDVKVYPTTISVENGKVVTKNNPVVSFSVWNSVGGDDATAMLDKVFTYNFSNVVFALNSGSTATNVLVGYAKHNSTPNAAGIAVLNYNDCTFDYRSVTSTATINVFNANPTGGTSKIKATVNVNGGELLLADLSKANVTLTESGSTLLFGKGEDGKYLTVSIPEGTAVPTAAQTFATAEGNMTLKKVGTANGIVTYELGLPIKTVYGDIPTVYADENGYPFAIFKDGVFVGAYATWKATGNAATAAAAGNANAGSTVTILLRRDFENVNSDTFWSITQAAGKIVLDLDGHTFTRKSIFMDLSAGAYNGEIFTTDILVKNGDLLAFNGPFVASQYNNVAGVENKVFNITFENVDFGFAKGATTTNFMWVVWDNSRDFEGGRVNAVFNNCNFDLTTNAPSGKVTVFNLSDTYNRVHIDVKVNGGSFIAGDVSKIVMLKSNGTKDTLTLGKHEGSYPTFKVSTGAAPSEGFMTAEGVKYYTESSVPGTYVLEGCDHSKTGNWIQENGKHYKLCQCGEKVDEAACSGGEADCVNKAECSVCGNEYGSVDATDHLGSTDGKWYQENDKR